MCRTCDKSFREGLALLTIGALLIIILVFGKYYTDQHKECVNSLKYNKGQIVKVRYMSNPVIIHDYATCENSCDKEKKSYFIKTEFGIREEVNEKDILFAYEVEELK